MDAKNELKDNFLGGDKNFRQYESMRLRKNEDYSRNQMLPMRKGAEDEYRIALGRRFILAAMRILRSIWSL
jgi:hypothetical protein